VLLIFIALKSPSPWPGFEPATFGSSGQHNTIYVVIIKTAVVSTDWLYILHLFLLPAVGEKLGGTKRQILAIA
jgi:hypothetical protein